MNAQRIAALVVAVVAMAGAAPQSPHPPRAVGRFAAAPLAYLPGSSIPLDVEGLTPPYHVTLTGPGSVDASAYHVPQSPHARSALLVAANAVGLAARRIAIAQPPAANHSFIAVASYDDGIVIHDARAGFAQRSVLGIGGPPSDVAIGPHGLLAAGNTDGTTLTAVRLNPWNAHTYPGIAETDELAIDDTTGAIYATDRDLDGAGALTRIDPDGAITTRVLGLTAEGIAIDARRRRIYVANVNDGTISIVNADSMVEERRFKAVARVFSLALSPHGTRLYAVSNQSLTSPFASAGGVVAFDVAGAVPRRVARSARLTFPVGIALDATHARLFVTDEHDNDIYVLDARTLRAVHAPLSTCRTPWKPAIDRSRLYIPCARANRVDVFSTRTLRRVAGAPFATGGYPLAVAVWHPPARFAR